MFDGVHLGHQAIIDHARAAAGGEGRVVAVTFSSSPATVLSPARVPPRVMTADRRASLLESAGVDELVVLDPTPELLAQDAESFIRSLAERFEFKHVVEGRDFRFGKGRRGDLALLRTVGEEMGFTVHPIDPVSVNLTDCSLVPARSSMVRRLLEQGRVRDAACVLGRPWVIGGEVVQGHQRGRTIGCPTANLNTGSLILPRDGVYAGMASMPDGETFPAAVSIGSNPSFGDDHRSCEAHLLGFEGRVGAYGWHLSIDLCDWIREQLIYEDLELLKQAIQADLGTVRSLISLYPCR